MRREVDRRTLLRLSAAGLLLSACQRAGGDSALPGLPDLPAPSPSPLPSPPPPPEVYLPLQGESIPNGKRTAARFVQALTTADDERTAEAAVARALDLTGTGFDADAVTARAAPLFTDLYSRGTILYPQVGGLVPNAPEAKTAAVMVVARQVLTSRSGRTKDVVRTFDVRLAVQGGVWRVVDLPSVGGEPVDRPDDLDPRAVRVLDDERVDLPDTARWDVHAGRVSLDLLDVLGAAARVAPVAVAVLQTSHPTNVFGTDRVSEHTQGRAVDIWRIGGRPLVQTGAASGPAREVLRGAYADRRLSQAGSPFGSDLDGPRRRRSFVNLVHKDHLHLAVKGAGPAGPE